MPDRGVSFSHVFTHLWGRWCCYQHSVGGEIEGFSEMLRFQPSKPASILPPHKHCPLSRCCWGDLGSSGSRPLCTWNVPSDRRLTCPIQDIHCSSFLFKVPTPLNLLCCCRTDYWEVWCSCRRWDRQEPVAPAPAMLCLGTGAVWAAWLFLLHYSVEQTFNVPLLSES